MRAQIDNLEMTRFEVVEQLRHAKVELLGVSAVKAYVNDIKELLSEGSIVEQHAFLRSFITRIEVHKPQVAIDYTIPLKKKQKR